MGDLKLFQLDNGTAIELTGTAMTLEKSLQILIEGNMETLFGVRCLASEYSTGKKHGGRMDSLGIDENGNPVIFEYKRAMNDNVITQGLFYLDWLMDHRGDFELLVIKRLGPTVTVDWSNPRLVCVAGDFNRYDEHAIGQMNRSIELVRYRSYEDRLLALDLVASTSAKATAAGEPTGQGPAVGSTNAVGKTKTVSQLHEAASPQLKDAYDAIEHYLVNLGDDVTKIVNKNYYAFRRLKNFACVEVHPQSGELLVYVKVDPDEVTLEVDFSRDVRSIGHFGTGDLELTLTSPEDVVRAQPFLDKSYTAS
jgi:predicted transport protein